MWIQVEMTDWFISMIVEYWSVVGVIQESPAQSPEAGSEAEEGGPRAAPAAEPAPPHQQIEAISSGTERTSQCIHTTAAALPSAIMASSDRGTRSQQNHNAIDIS